jgi:hypothetical protein
MGSGVWLTRDGELVAEQRADPGYYSPRRPTGPLR